MFFKQKSAYEILRSLVGSEMCIRDRIRTDYETETGRIIVERFAKLNPLHCPGVLVAGHGPFTWGQDVSAAVHNAVVLEFIAQLQTETLRINPGVAPLPPALIQKHFLRKHGATAYYGQ